MHKPTREQIAAAEGKTVPDVIAPNLDVLFCGINPGLYTAAVQQHFGRPGNRFWPTLHRAGFTPRLMPAFDEQELLAYRYGITNIVARATNAADALTRDELVAGARVLSRKVKKFTPRFLAIVGMQAYRLAFDRPNAKIGLQPEPIAATRIWILPNPSGLNAHYKPADLVAVYRELREAVDQT